MNLDESSIKKITVLRDQTAKFIDQQRLTVRRVQEVNTNPIPLTVLAYQYYGSIDDVEALKSLNAFREITRISGDIKVLTK